MAHVPVRTSVGVIVVRWGADLRPEALLIRKRYTYAFADFVHGRYPRSREAAWKAAAALFGRMTFEELIDIRTLDFGQMWHRIWLTRDPRSARFHRAAAKFRAVFLADGGAALRALLLGTAPSGRLVWEVPKGRHQFRRETDLGCAMRELEEETGVQKREYRLIPGARRHASHVSDGVRYTSRFFVALAGPSLRRPGPRPTLGALIDAGEVGDLGWFDVARLRLLEPGGALERLVAPAFRLAKNYAKGQWPAGQRPAGQRPAAPGPGPAARRPAEA